MKTIKQLTTALLMLIAFSVVAQQGINYKALIKDGTGTIVANQSITIQFQILQGIAGTMEYQETHAPTTDTNGIVVVNIGEGSVDNGIYADIDWGSDDHYLNVQIDTGGGLTDMGTTQFMAVPYALSAKAVKPCNLQIGDLYAGGMIFYLDGTGCHGLVTATSDISSGMVAFPIEQIFENTMSAIGAGTLNTKSIVRRFDLGGQEGEYAAKLCDDLILNGYDDWYLPSRYESALMFYNVGGGMDTPLTNIAGFSSGYYWTSTVPYYVQNATTPFVVYSAYLSGLNCCVDFDSSWSLYNLQLRERPIRSF